MDFVGTVWALLPPVIAIVLALITKEVYMSLFIGVVTGALLYTNFSPVGTIEAIFEVMMEKLGDSWNVGILIFLVFLGIIVALMTRAGGSAAYGKWAGSKIKTRSGALLSTFALGVVIFVDDYFNCLTVGNVMRPVTDKQKISRAKLAYIIDATAAPICIIAPISSWAAAVTGYTNGDGFSLFLQTIPFNLYAWLTILMVIFIGVTGLDYGPMKKFEENAAKGDLFSGKNDYENVKENIISAKGKVIDLVLPVIFLIASCIICMIYTGGFFEGESFINAFANCDASMGLVMGSFITLVFVFLLYLPRRVITFSEFAECIPQGFKMMVSAILILVLAWTLGGFCSTKLEAGTFVSSMLSGNVSGNRSDARCLHCSLPCRFCLRRSHVADLRHNDHGLCRSAVPPCRPCIHTASLRADGRWLLRGRLSGCRIHKERIPHNGSRRDPAFCCFIIYPVPAGTQM